MASSRVKGRSNALTQEGGKRQRVAKKLNRRMRERVNPPIQEGIERARERVANMMFPAVRRISQCIPHDQEEEATT